MRPNHSSVVTQNGNGEQEERRRIGGDEAQVELFRHFPPEDMEQGSGAGEDQEDARKPGVHQQAMLV